MESSFIMHACMQVATWEMMSCNNMPNKMHYIGKENGNL